MEEFANYSEEKDELLMKLDERCKHYENEIKRSTIFQKKND